MKRYTPIIKFGLAPIINPDSRVIILGTLPGNDSLVARQYYANPNNQFWSLIADRALPTYDLKMQFLREKQIALWDVLQSASRYGSSDRNISNERPNDFDDFFAKYPSIEYIYFNGTSAKAYFEKYYLKWMHSKVCMVLPSSSQRLEMGFDLKKLKWKDVVSHSSGNSPTT